MSDSQTQPIDSEVAKAMKVFDQQNCTIGKSISVVTIHCANADDATSVFEWLSGLGCETEELDHDKKRLEFLLSLYSHRFCGGRAAVDAAMAEAERYKASLKEKRGE